MLNLRTILRIIGLILVVEAGFMLLTVPVSLIYDEGAQYLPLLISSGITLALGFAFYLPNRRIDLRVNRRDGYLIVTLSWLMFSLLGTLPFILTGSIPNFTNAFFETISGFTTTGASILNNIEELSHGILFWRSLIQWLGGMGIILLTLLLLPFLGIGAMQLFSAEVPSPTPDKLHPHVKDTASRLWLLYVMFTLAETLLLWAGEMNLFDSVCHSLTTMATGGFSTKQASIGHWDSPYIHYVVTLFMFLAGTNFTLAYFGLHGKFRRIRRDEEFRWYIGFIIFFTLVSTLGLFITRGGGFEVSFRNSIFQVVSLLTTTGFGTSDYLLWAPWLLVLMLILMFIGGSAGSTGGGPKVMRIMIMLKNSTMELKRMIHPNAVIPVRLNKMAVAPEVVTSILAFLAFYAMIFVISIAIMSIFGYDLDTSIGAVVASLGNIGPGIGDVGPASNFAAIKPGAKWFLSFLMLVGRLELFTVLVLFSPQYWRR